MTESQTWRPRHDDPLFILAMDHRGSFGKSLFDVEDDQPTDQQLAGMTKAKQLIYDGLTQAAPRLDRGRAGVLVDEQYGQAVIDRAGTEPVVLAIPIEESGQDWFTLQWGDAWLEHLHQIQPAYAKILVRDNPDFDPAKRRDQLDALSRVSDGLHQAGVPLLYELLVPGTDEQLAAVGKDADRYDRDVRPGLVARVMAENQAAGVEPTLWKIEGLDTVAGAQQVAEQARADGRDTDLIVLGRDAPAERLYRWIEVATEVEAFVGFAIGRSIWEDVISDWVADKVDDQQASDQIAARYSDFAGRWTTGH